MHHIMSKSIINLYNIQKIGRFDEYISEYGTLNRPLYPYTCKLFKVYELCDTPLREPFIFLNIFPIPITCKYSNYLTLA